jgi:hypothetical protein
LPTPIEIWNWNLRKYGDTWKFVIYERDNGATTNISTSLTSNFGTNFSNEVKDGPKFGSTGSSGYSQTFSYSFVNGSDPLTIVRYDFDRL